VLRNLLCFFDGAAVLDVCGDAGGAEGMAGSPESLQRLRAS